MVQLVRTVVLLALAPLTVYATSAPSPDSLSLTSTTRGQASFNRPTADLAALSPIGTAVPFVAVYFEQGQGDTLSVVVDWEEYQDGMLFLYRGAFEPQNPLLNLVAGIDNGPFDQVTTAKLSKLVRPTQPGSHVLVVTGFANDDVGRFRLAANVRRRLARPLVGEVYPRAGLADTPILIQGHGFEAGAQVSIGGQAATGVVVEGDSQIRCNAPPPLAPGPADVTVVTSRGTATARGRFEYGGGGRIPRVTRIEPPFMDTVRIPMPIRIFGEGFSSTTEVSFRSGSQSAEHRHLVAVSDSELVCWVPNLNAGVFEVRVTTPTGTSALGPGLTVQDDTLAVTRAVFADTTLGGSLFARPAENGVALSAADQVAYVSQRLVVSRGGSNHYAFSAEFLGGQRGRLLLYRGGFDPARPLERLLHASSDGRLRTANELSTWLVEGERYDLVVTGETNSDAGPFALTIRGARALEVPGQVLTVSTEVNQANPPAPAPVAFPISSRGSPGCALSASEPQGGGLELLVLVIALLGLTRLTRR